ncbi:hypothetical protein JCM31271_34710 [Halorubrum trueperi]
MVGSEPANEAVLNVLIEAAVLEESESGTVKRTRRFMEAVKDAEECLECDGVESEWFGLFGRDGTAETDLGTLTATARAVESFVTDLERKQAASVAISLQRFEESVRTEGVPDPVTALAPFEIEGFCSRYPCSAVIVWKADSESSSLVFDDFAELAGRPAFENVGFGAVHAPDYPETAHEQYSIGILPTVLFFVGTDIDSRLVGAHHPQTFERELSVVVERAVDSVNAEERNA